MNWPMDQTFSQMSKEELKTIVRDDEDGNYNIHQYCYSIQRDFYKNIEDGMINLGLIKENNNEI